MKTSRRILVALAGIATLAIPGLLLAAPSDGNGAYSKLSTQGELVAIASVPAVAAVQSHAHHTHTFPNQARIIAQHGLLTFYVQEQAGEPTCYGTGSLQLTGELVPGSVTCLLPGAKFPSAEEPVLVRLGLDAKAATGATTIRAFTGFAADGVASLAVYSTKGTEIARQAVAANSFSIPLVGTRRDEIGQLAAFDGDGSEIYRLNMTRASS